MNIRKNVMFTQTKGCKFCLHIGTTAFYFGHGVKGKQGFKLEIFTPNKIIGFTR